MKSNPKMWRASILALGTILTTARVATAEQCQQAYEKELTAAKAAGDNEAIQMLQELPQVPLYSLSHEVVCFIRLSADMHNNPNYVVWNASKYNDVKYNKRSDGLDYNYIGPNGERLSTPVLRPVLLLEDPHERPLYTGMPTSLSKDADAMQVAKNDWKFPSIENHLASFVGSHRTRELSFAGIKVGMSLSQVFEIMSKSNFTEDQGWGHKDWLIWNKKYQYKPSCSKNWDSTHEHNISTCGVQSIKFNHKDGNGAVLTIEVDFTEFEMPTRNDALENARVFYIDGSVSLKQNVGKSYYEALAQERYGSQLSFETSNFVDRDRDFFKIEPSETGLTVEIKSDSYANEKNSILKKHLIELETSNAKTAPKPQF